MNELFDKLIADAKPEVPRVGSDRRTARLLLLERSRTTGRRTRIRRTIGVCSAVGLVILAFFGPPVNELGSDAFEFEADGGVTVDGTWYPKHSAKIRDQVISGPTREEAGQVSEAIASGQFVIDSMFGTEIDGQIFWTASVRTEIGGEMQNVGSDIELPSSRETEAHGKLFDSPFYADMLKTVYRTPPRSTRQAVIDGIPVTLKTWVFEFADIGLVRFHIGEAARNGA